MAKTYTIYQDRQYIWAVETALRKRCGSIAKAESLLSPLTWYIGTGRASLDFMRALVATRPYYIACILAKGGSDMAVVDAIKRRIGYEAYC